MSDKEQLVAREHPETQRPQRRIFYGWWIVFAAWAATLLNSTTTFSGFGAFFLPILREFNATRAGLTWVVSAARLEGSLLGPLEGWLVDRYGPRRMMSIGMPLLGLGFILISLVSSLPLFYLVFLGGIALGASLGTSTPGNVAVVNWFIKKRGTALGIVNTGFSMGAVLVPVLAFLIDRTGWRGAALLIGFAILVLGMPLALLMRHRPEDYGYLPDGEAADPPPTAIKVGERDPVQLPVAKEVNLTAGQALLTPAFWLLGLSMAARTVATVAMNVHQIPFFLDVGFSITEAAVTVSAVGVVSFLARVAIGWLSDHMNRQVLMAIMLLLLGTSLEVLAQVDGRESIFVPVYIVTYGIAWGGTNPVMGALRADFFGRRSIGSIGGFMSLLTLLGTMGGPLMAAYVYDFTGSYNTAFVYIGVVSLVGAVLILLARRPAPGKVQSMPQPL